MIAVYHRLQSVGEVSPLSARDFCRDAQLHIRRSRDANRRLRPFLRREAAQKLERYYTDNGTYTTSLGPLYGLATAATVYSGVNNDTASAYTITAAAPSGSTIAAGYVLTATQNAGGHFRSEDRRLGLPL